jgi:serine/threonine protein kinase
MLAIGQTLRHRYYTSRLLGRGGMGAVYLAQDIQQPGCWVAIKELIPDPHASSRALAQARGQFQSEAQVLMALQHPNLPRVYEYFSEGGNEYLVMQYIQGRNLLEIAADDWGQGRSLGESRVLGWAMQIMDVLEYLHGQRPYPVLHRDIKPQNIILTPGGELYLVDFGLVKLLDPRNPQTMTVLRGLGTPEYAPPEQYASSGVHTGAYSDIYALGATLYHLLTGQAPPTATDRLLPPSLAKPLIPPRQLNLAISPSVEGTLVKALELEPAQRFASAGEMRRALLATPDSMGGVSPPVSSSKATATLLSGVRGLPRVAMVGAGLVVVGVVVALAMALSGTPTVTSLATHSPTAMPTETLATLPSPTSPPALGNLSVTVDENTPTPTASPASSSPTQTPTRTPVPSATPTAAHTPAAMPTPVPTASVVEDFGVYDDGQLQSAYAMNAAWGTNAGSIHLDSRAGAPVMVLNYAVNGAPPDDYIVLERCFVPGQDWSGADYLQVWAQNDNLPKQLIVQFGEGQRCAGEPFSGEVWRAFVAVAPGQAGLITLPLSDFEWADWSPSQDHQMELSQIGYFALGIQGSGMASGSISFGPVLLVQP